MPSRAPASTDLANASHELRANSGQWAAYESSGNCVVTAGPGSGKTKVLVLKTARILEEDLKPPGGLACLTFSNECARELRRKLRYLGVVRRPNLFVGTLHSFCLRHVIGPYAKLGGLGLPDGWRVASDSERSAAFVEGAKETSHAATMISRHEFDEFRRLLRADRRPDYVSDEQAKFVDNYEKALRRRGVVDFEDLSVLGRKLIEDHEWVRKALKARFPVFAVDEYQDLGVALHDIIVKLLGTGVRVLAVGDADQSIYKFQGATPALFHELVGRKDFSHVKLRLNYRCARDIVNGSLGLLGDGADYEAHSAEKGAIHEHECSGGPDDQVARVFQQIVPDLRARGFSLGRIAILYRDKNDGSRVAAAAQAAGLNFVRIDNGAPYAKTPFTRWVEDCVNWCAKPWGSSEIALGELIETWLGFHANGHSPSVRNAARQALVCFLWNARDAAMPVSAWCRQLDQQVVGGALQRESSLSGERPKFDALIHAVDQGELAGITLGQLIGQRGNDDVLNLMTLHGAKGLEFDAVVLIGADEGRLPDFRKVNDDDELREERRLFYVGVTRARKEVHVVYSGFTVDKSGRKRVNGRSRFIGELTQRLLAEADDDSYDVCDVCDPGEDRPPPLVHWSATPTVGSLRTGTCDWCNTLSGRCDGCGDTFALEDDAEETCSCGTTFRHVVERNHHGEIEVDEVQIVDEED